MPESIGELGHLGIVSTSSLGHYLAPTTFTELTSARIDSRRTDEFPANVRGTRAPRRAIKGQFRPEGTYSHPVAADGIIGYELKGVFGAVASSLINSHANGQVYRHVFTHVESPGLPIWGIEKYNGGQDAQRFSGIRFDSLTFTMPRGDTAPLTAELGVMGRDYITTTNATPTFATDAYLVYEGMSALLSDAAYDATRNWGITFRNNLAGDVMTAGQSGLRGRLPAQAFDVSGNLSLLFERWAEYNEWRSFTDQRLQFNIVGANIDGTNSYVRQLQIIVPLCKYTTPEIPLETGVIDLNLGFTAVRPSTGTHAHCILFSTVGSY